MNTSNFMFKHFRTLLSSVLIISVLIILRVVYVQTMLSKYKASSKQQITLTNDDATKIAFNMLNQYFGANKNYYVVSASELQVISGKTILNAPRIAWVIRFNKYNSIESLKGNLPGYINLIVDANTGNIIGVERSR